MIDPAWKSGPVETEVKGEVEHRVEFFRDGEWTHEGGEPGPDCRVVRVTHGRHLDHEYCETCDHDIADCECRYRVEDAWGDEGMRIREEMDNGTTRLDFDLWAWDADNDCPVKDVLNAIGLTDVTDDVRWFERLPSNWSRLYREPNGYFWTTITRSNLESVRRLVFVAASEHDLAVKIGTITRVIKWPDGSVCEVKEVRA